MDAAKGNRWGNRDSTMLLVAYRHGLRASELVDLRWDQVDFGTATLHVRRVKTGHPQHSPRHAGRTAGPCAATPGAGAKVPIRVHQRAGCAVHHRRLRADDGAGRGRGDLAASRRTRTCCDTLAASRWPTRATTHGPCKPILATGTSSTP